MHKSILAVCAATVMMASGALGASIAVQSGGISGLSFTEGVGSSGDPWVITEDMTAPGTLVIRDPGTGNPPGTIHSWGRWASKTVTNNSADIWTSFELELQVDLGTPSGQGDGLSFADGDPIRFTFSSDKFSTYTRIDTTRDYLNFSGGSVGIGETVTFNFVMTDGPDRELFYLLQTPNREDIPDVPEPGSFWLAGAGLVAAGWRFRRIRTRAAS